MLGGSVAVVGGSIAGCATALAAVRGGADKVTIIERAAGQLEERGVGVSLQGQRYAELEAAGYVDADIPWGALNRRVWTVRDGEAPLGRAISVQDFPFRAYSWGSLWSELRSRVPGQVEYRSGVSVTSVDEQPDGVDLEFADGGRERFDVVIGADGYRSVVRDTMFPGLKPTYAGYLGWRGATVGTPECPPEVAADLEWTDLRTVVFPGGHCVLYLIPDGAGGVRVNWVLYTTPPEHLAVPLDLRTPTSLPPGRLTTELSDFARDLVSKHFPPFWAECVLRTPREESFIQPIYDLEVPHYATGRLALAGDAATVARPHTGGGAVKALQDALVLENSWREGGSWQEIAATYDEDRTALGASIVDLGRRFGQVQVVDTPNWEAMRTPDFDAWWTQQNGGSDRSSGYGGHALKQRG
ncbi:monooxygenase [Streptomyces sp. NA04227]|uniref:monooxygenase n=1 Tax=Streptomyces sp. NA04227 TaxID=2742136 RepID=UPI001591827E|nr:monooxygenase [Streptomyces sp. NA04227]QKW05180.1 monooxygenase [Streptomyces sp. NA04227]